MRQQLGLTQAQLAKRLRVALATVGRWESWDPPRRITLARLARFAQFNKLPIAAVFQAELDKENKDLNPRPKWFRLQSDEEAKYVRATLLILRDPEYAEVRPKLREFMASLLNVPDF